MALSETKTKFSLFGGAIALDLPQTWQSAADLTAVPDNQECFVLRAGAGDAGRPRSPLSLVVEVLERAEDAGLDRMGCAAFFLRDLAEHDGASPRDVEAAVAGGSRAVDLAREMPRLGLADGGARAAGAECWRAQGVARVAQRALPRTGGGGPQAAALEPADDVLLLVAVLRLPSVATDLLVTLNAPLRIAGVDATGGDEGAAVREAEAALAGALASLEIADFGLFG